VAVEDQHRISFFRILVGHFIPEVSKKRSAAVFTVMSELTD